MDVVQRPVIFYYRRKGSGYKQIPTQLISASRRDAYRATSAKHWVREYDSGRRDRTDAFKSRRPRSDISEAVSTLLTEQPFSLTKSPAVQLRVSG
jgi:hypothetical protein